jgi:hypothetical protein
MPVTQDQVGLFLFPGDPSSRIDIDDFETAMAEIEKGLANKKQFIFLIHGRGEHPFKAYNKDILKDLEKQYNAEVLMFQWPAQKEKKNKFPQDRARCSSIFLKTVLEKLKAYKDKPENKDRWKNFHTTLLAHSMGNIVLQDAVESHNLSLGQELFDNIILNASAVGLLKHKEWVDRLDFAQNVYIAMYAKDGVLKRARKYVSEPFLGRQVKVFKKNPQLQSDQAIYLLLINPGVSFFKSHKYYVGIKKKRPLTKVYKNIMRDAPNPLNIKGVSQFRRNVFEIRNSFYI